MQSINTNGIILRRTNYGESDRILTLLTKDAGKITVMAKGVRKSTSKLAGGIEFFSESNVSFIKGRGEINTLVSTRLIKHYQKIVSSLQKTQTAYDILRTIDQVTENSYEQEYYSLTIDAFTILQEVKDGGELTWAWFLTQLLKLTGHEPELAEDADYQPLIADKLYEFDFQAGRFRNNTHGVGSEHIKMLRLLRVNDPLKLERVRGLGRVLPDATAILQQAAQFYLHIKPVY